MNFNDFIKKLSEFYNEKPTMAYVEVMKSELNNFNDYQLNELFFWFVRNISRSFKSMPGPMEIKKAKEVNSIKLFPANLETKNKIYLAKKSGKYIEKPKKKAEPQEEIQDFSDDISKIFKNFKEKTQKNLKKDNL